MPVDNWDEALRFDREHLWHPYTSMLEPSPVWPVESAEGVRLKLADGRELIDGMASWWCAVHGYNHPTLNAAMQAQLAKTPHVMFGGLTHEPAIELGRRLVDLTPAPLEKVFLADSGSVSIEVAMKMAIQYWQSRGEPGKHRMLSLRQGYHGDTLGAMSVCDPVTGMHHIFSGVVTEQLFAPAPTCRYDQSWDAGDLEAMAAMIEQHRDELAAVMLEPVVQGAGGMHFYHPEYLRGVRELCDRHGVLLIADEIATGFGRSGRLFAFEHAGISPDIMCLGKALTGGTMTLAATLATREIGETISRGGAGVFMHGPTFMGNPLACAAAVASIDLLLANDWQGAVQRLQAGLQQGLAPCAALPGVADVRALGAIGVVQLEQPVDMHDLVPRFVEAGVWVRPFGRMVYLMPPYVMNDADLATLTGAVHRVLADVQGG